MNTALWMLYFADVASSISGLLSACSVLCVIGLIVWWIAFAITNDEYLGSKQGCKQPSRWLYATALACAIVASLIPSKDTFYAIAAANVGDAALHTQTGDKAIKALNAWLDRQISGDEGKSK